MKSLLIVWHSMTTGARQMARAAAQGAQAAGDISVNLSSARETGSDEVLAADGFLFVTPENLASMSGMMKDFFDRTYYAALDRINGRPYAILVCAGSDGSNAVRQIQRIATGWRLREVAAPIIVNTTAQTPPAIFAIKTIAPDQLRLCHDRGALLAAGLAAAVW